MVWLKWRIYLCAKTVNVHGALYTVLYIFPVIRFTGNGIVLVAIILEDSWIRV